MHLYRGLSVTNFYTEHTESLSQASHPLRLHKTYDLNFKFMPMVSSFYWDDHYILESEYILYIILFLLKYPK